MGKRLDPAAIAKKWKERTAAATEAYKAGINAVTENPMEKAADAADRMLAGVQKAVQSGRFARKLRDKSFTDWKQKATGKGAQNIGTGVAAAEADTAKALAPVLKRAEEIRDEVAGMERGTIENSIARAAHAIRRMAELKES